VICSPLFVEGERNYRREVLLARRLAELGVACIRFHYRGTGNSDWLERISPSSMAEDATTAGEELAALGIRSFGAVGTRMGAHTAVRLGVAWPGAPLALWEPVIHPSKWVREVRRTSRIAALTDHRGPIPARDNDAPIEAVGYLFDAAEFAGAAELEPPAGGPLLLVQLSRDTSLTHSFIDTARSWSSRNVEVQPTNFVLDQPWWFLDHGWTAAEEGRQDDGLCAMTARWLAERLGQ
jgi:pimeloyl-ACP methyl ester carboxylesterase